MESRERRIAGDLLSIKAVFFRPDEPFIWASGIKSPVYCDNRLTLTAPAVRNQVENALAEVEPIYEELPGFSEDISTCKHFDGLPYNVQKYIQRLEALTQVRISYVSVGPDREQTIVR